ncbi:MAG: hypothetical protein KatS3mg115_2653 [Candidatus Poribacteria bacterium]|nr:MAG: hypothetical protein KatS3mg115_2653 [Candidatus Poribacteria bacterium]
MFPSRIKILIVPALLTAGLVWSGCAAYVATPLPAGLYVDMKGPVAVTGNGQSSKVGRASATSFLGLIATGDASIQTAAASAGITRIHHVDFEAKSILGIVATYTTVVYGE